jgi:transcriptional regulator with XRE-family HTH domain
MSSVIVRKLDSLRKAGAMNITDVANVLGTTPATVSRWNSGKASPKRSKELLLVELEYIVDRLQEFYTPEEARLWLFSRHRLLNDRKPADLIQEGDIDSVLAVIEQLSDLVYV